MDSIDLSIPVSTVTQYTQCPVCMSELKSTTLTRCGHRYCEHCIKEWINRRHTCPCCNARLSIQDLVKDHQFDELIKVSSEAVKKAEAEYFDKLINKQPAGPGTSGDGNDDSFSPVEIVLKKHVKGGLVAHEKYYQGLKTEWYRKKDFLLTETDKLIEDLKSQNLSQNELDKQTADLKQRAEARLVELQEELSTVTNMVADAYDRHLSEHIPDLAILPCRVTLHVLCKNVKMDYILKPNDSISDLQDEVTDSMEQLGDSILEYGEIHFVSFGPFTKASNIEMIAMCRDMIVHHASHPDVHLLPSDCKPLLQFSLKPGSEICVYGVVKCKSDMPKQCFSKMFEPGKSHKVDYFTCKDCAMNWICRNCMEVCHKEHHVVPYIMNHQPTWACCYCPKKNKCLIQGSQLATASSFHKQWTKC